ncbi:gp40 [Shigella phage Buco]|uniref:Putative tail protein n=1 Tax=Shigella phage Buco TaxID=2530183 RepID=A0A482JLU9_9CAUD|nr:gp40 [Shigella phage Buco]QBP32940.1 putative tail protein [Shigella phage Buco]8ES4_E Chain E, Gp40 [Shigella phage Buco]
MAQTFEGTLQSLLQGVSQQIPRERQPGQLGAQQNMLSDPVTGLRRRPPLHLAAQTLMENPVSPDALFSTYIERGTDGRHLLINTEAGIWQILSKDATTLIRSGQADYLKASIGATSIQTASIAGLTYILNTEQTPVAHVDNTGKLNPANTGFFYIVASSFSKRWTITVQSNEGTWTAVHDVGASSDDGAVPAATASAVINSLKTNLLAAGMPSDKVDTFGSYMFIKGLTNVVVSSDAGTTYARWSNQSRVDEESDLPAQLPASANGCMCRVGAASTSATWYRFDYATRQWNEDSAYSSITKITNMPLEFAADDQIIPRDFEGRLAGDDENNEDPGFVENGYITGIAAFQGRLVLLSGSRVSMSASGLYQRFYRSTVVNLLDTDRIDIGAASAQDSVFRAALQFNRDLVVFGDSMQAVIAGNAVLTPTNASIALTSEFSCDSRVIPVVTGQTVLYASRRNSDYAGLLEFIPSAYTSSQYVSQDATVHLPRYIPGRVMDMQVSSVTNVAFFRYSGERTSVLVYEFLWGEDAKRAQGAYHKWVLPYDVLSLHTLSEAAYFFVRGPGAYVLALRVDPREGFVAGTTYEYPFMDMGAPVTVQGGQFTLPEHLRKAGLQDSIALAYYTGDDSGSELGIASISSNWVCTTVRGVPDGNYLAGYRFKSGTTLTPPMLKDQNDNLIGSGHVRLLRLDVAMRNSGVVDVLVEDNARDVDNDSEYSGVLMNSKELAPEQPLKASLSNIIIPCRTNTDTTEVTLSTSGTLEMNIMDVSYILRYNQRRRRV